ncbi:MAG: SH3 domain-containing protein [Bacteriovoracaceae bacterium]|nr:SH3 domain-containing protein [Bacteriovoracaceae bacterium]
MQIKVLLFIVISLLLSSCGSGFHKITSREGLDARSAPNVESVVVGKLHYGTQVKLLKQKGSWKQFEYNQLDGWVHKEYIKGDRVVANGGLKVRRGPGAKFGLVITLPRNTKVEIIEENKEWALIKVKKSAWGASKFIQPL